MSCRHKNSTDDAPVIPCHLLRNGDLAFRRGTGVVSHAIISAEKRSAKRRYSHVGIVIQKDDIWMVIHAVPGETDSEKDFDKMKLEPLSVFLGKERATAGEVMRVDVDSLIADCAAMHAFRLYEEQTPFNHKYDLADSTRLYCTQLIDWVYKKQGVDLSEGRITRLNIPGINGDYLFPSDIQQSNMLYTLFYY